MKIELQTIKAGLSPGWQSVLKNQFCRLCPFLNAKVIKNSDTSKKWLNFGSLFSNKPVNRPAIKSRRPSGLRLFMPILDISHSLLISDSSRLHKAEDNHLGGDHAHEHRERIDCGVCHGGSVVVGGLVGVGKSRGIGVATAHHTADGEIIEFVFCAGHNTDHHEGNNRDDG